MRPPHRQIARLIAQIAVLFKRAVVFFVYHHQPQLPQRREHRQPRAHHQGGLPALRTQIILGARPGGGLAVQYRGAGVGETLLYACQQLRGKIDFRQQKQHLPPRRQHLGHDVEIHFGFAAAGDAVQQKRRKAATGCLNGLAGGLLFFIQYMRRRRHRTMRRAGNGV